MAHFVLILFLIFIQFLHRAQRDEPLLKEIRKLKACRLNALTTEQMNQLITGEPLPLTDDDNDCLSDIVDANQGKIVKGLEKWL